MFNFAHNSSLQFLIKWLLFASIFIIWSSASQAEKRRPDPDGCFSCHGLPDLKYIDKQGQLRSASILVSDYYGSLHGSVPCKDCHRKISDYPHEEKDGLVDCGESCHVKEPSDGKGFTHKKIVSEFEKSAHGKGWSKKFAAGNRMEEDHDSSLPSCRRCHANTPYIADSQWEAFKEGFAHNDKECGTCHEGDVWRDQFSGHILRRYIGNKINKKETNAICVDCHGNLEKMSKVEQEDYISKQKHPVSQSFIHSVETYDKTLHGRLTNDGSLFGASCIDCHGPEGLHHGILDNDNPLSATHKNHLPETCGQSGCHSGYAKNPLNEGFLTTEMHGIANIALNIHHLGLFFQNLTGWHIAALILTPLALIVLLGSVFWSWKGDASKLQKNTNNSLVGAQKFQVIMIGSKPKATKSVWNKLGNQIEKLKQKFLTGNQAKNSDEDPQ